MGKDKWIVVSAGTARYPRWYVCSISAGEGHYVVQAECRSEYAAKRLLDAMRVKDGIVQETRLRFVK